VTILIPSHSCPASLKGRHGKTMAHVVTNGFHSMSICGVCLFGCAICLTYIGFIKLNVLCSLTIASTCFIYTVLYCLKILKKNFITITFVYALQILKDIFGHWLLLGYKPCSDH
jgi:hypothetical protein